MSLTRYDLHRSETAGIHLVRCRPHDHVCGPDECSTVNTLAFPLRGLFVKHRSARERVVADACHAIFFSAGEPYRVSHPVAGGDECLVIQPSPATMIDVLGRDAFERSEAVLDIPLLAKPRLLWHRLAHRMASELEAEESALDLLAATAGGGPVSVTRSRQRDMVEATKIALAQTDTKWTLRALARRVHSSPFHLARTFRAITGVPLHRYDVRARLAAALVQVLDSSRELNAIALDLGFSSHSHFTQSFRTAFGSTPARVRKDGKISTAVRSSAA